MEGIIHRTIYKTNARPANNSFLSRILDNGTLCKNSEVTFHINISISKYHQIVLVSQKWYDINLLLIFMEDKCNFAVYALMP